MVFALLALSSGCTDNVTCVLVLVANRLPVAEPHLDLCPHHISSCDQTLPKLNMQCCCPVADVAATDPLANGNEGYFYKDGAGNITYLQGQIKPGSDAWPWPAFKVQDSYGVGDDTYQLKGSELYGAYCPDYMPILNKALSAGYFAPSSQGMMDACADFAMYTAIPSVDAQVDWQSLYWYFKRVDEPTLPSPYSQTYVPELVCNPMDTCCPAGGMKPATAEVSVGV